ncbi:hypothetical protein BGZ83_011428 [Gryganskiella cystojenkinii]|nr:hypothetical protein BGZ83_011428 [Gryganskiella cystojenkinii]
MKFTFATVLASAVLALAVTAQNSTDCTLCLQKNLMALPACNGLNITVGDINPGVTPQYAVCLCSSLSGAWIDACTTTCGPDIVQFKQTYAQSMQQAGLNCNGTTPTFNPGPTDPVAPSSALPTGTAPGGSKPSSVPGGAGGSGSAGATTLPWTTEVVGALAVIAAVGASFL